MVQVLCSDGYGSMLWDLQSTKAEEYFRSWNTTVKLAWGVPRSCFTYLVEGFLAEDQTALRNQILSRYPGFYRSLLESPSKEVRMLVNMVNKDPRSMTCVNLRYLRKATKMDQAEQFSSLRIREALPVQQVPQKERWRLGLLTSLLKMSKEKYTMVQDSKQITAMIDSLCST